MKEIQITCYWLSTHNVEVPDDFVVPETLDEFPEDILEKLNTSGATLTDWE